MKLTQGLDDLAHRRLLRRWSRAGAQAPKLDYPTLRQLRSQANGLRRRLDRVIHVADHRLTRPRLGSNAISAPAGSEWTWRPEIWMGPLTHPGSADIGPQTAIGDEATLFHNCHRPELAFRQTRNRRDEDLAPFGLMFEIFGFDGSFLSLALSLPQQAAKDLRRDHIVQVDADIDTEAPCPITARLNIRHGPNCEQITQELPIGPGRKCAEFDLAYAKLNEKRIEAAWLDIFFDQPKMNCIKMHDVTFSRRLRAAL